MRCFYTLDKVRVEPAATKIEPSVFALEHVGNATPHSCNRI